MMGRKPLPTHIKLVKGTARPHRLNPSEPKPPLAVPEPPPHLEDREKAKFTAMAEMLVRRGVMTELDAGALARYATAWCRWVDAAFDQILRQEDLVAECRHDRVK